MHTSLLSIGFSECRWLLAGACAVACRLGCSTPAISFARLDLILGIGRIVRQSATSFCAAKRLKHGGPFFCYYAVVRRLVWRRDMVLDTWSGFRHISINCSADRLLSAASLFYVVCVHFELFVGH